MTQKIIAIQKVLFPDKPEEWDGRWGNKCKAALEALVNPPSVLPEIESGAADSVDSRSEKNIATLHRKLQPIARQLVKMAAANGILVQILSGTRTYAEQDALYRQAMDGRDNDGDGRIDESDERVTKAPAGHSNHNFGIAFDTGIFVNGKYIDEEYDKKRFSGAEMERLYTKLGQLGKSLGLAWGGDWKGFPDQPHFQLEPPWASGMSEPQMLAELRRRHDNGIDPFA